MNYSDVLEVVADIRTNKRVIDILQEQDKELKVRFVDYMQSLETVDSSEEIILEAYQHFITEDIGDMQDVYDVAEIVYGDDITDYTEKSDEIIRKAGLEVP
jgi:hypothetical protein